MWDFVFGNEFYIKHTKKDNFLKFVFIKIKIYSAKDTAKRIKRYVIDW